MPQSLAMLKKESIRVVQKLQFLQAMHGGHAWLGQQALKTCSISSRVIEQVHFKKTEMFFISKIGNILNICRQITFF
jgi:hypothetical protein